MDTDDLSNETYEAVILTAERFNHDLTLQFGLLSYSCETETEYLDAAEELIKEWLTSEYIKEEMQDIFFGNPPSKQSFYKTINKILVNIESVRKIPIENRKFEF
jgi:HEPN domain-containing protein